MDIIIPTKSGKLTKKFYMQIPTGLYLISSVGWTPTEPIFAEMIESKSGREKQWKRIVGCAVSQRMCFVFKDKKTHLKWVKQMLKNSGR